ncbi:MAG: helix-turn-helix domain-containing protein [Lachnospiraceae bacterium]|nr:helix-turn-helix domain-containing protein [Lachnospiraceae bacterium]
MITEKLYMELKKITEEEDAILKGHHEIEKDRYMGSGTDVIDAAKLLESGKLIQVRPHTRFAHFPRHTHNYIEMIYMCSGSTRHVVDGEDIILREGELLFLNRKAEQEIYPAGEEDIAVNFIILPEFFEYTLKMIGEEKNLLRDFVVDCLMGRDERSGYMHFKVAEVLPIQNLVENLIWTIWNRQPNRRSINQATMGLLFLQLLNHLDSMETKREQQDQRLVIEVLGYIEEHYRDGELRVLAKQLNYDFYWLSKEIKKQTGKTFTELLQEKRLNQAAYLLQNTSRNIQDIGLAVGYDNQSYFYRIFKEQFGKTPKKFREKERN